FPDEANGDRRKPGRLAQEGGGGLRAARTGEAGGKLRFRKVRPQVDRGGGAAGAIQLRPQGAGKCVERAALDATLGDDQFAALAPVADAQCDALQRLAGEAAGKVLRPFDMRTGIAWL